MLNEILQDNNIIIIPSNIKNKIIKQISNKLINVKIITINELKEKLTFSYDTRAIKYIMDKNNINYPNAKELINNMYYLFDDNYDNKKLSALNKLKQELIDNKLITIDPYFINNLNNKNIYFYGFDYLTKYNLKLIDILKKYTNVNIISKPKGSFNHQILSFNHLNDEIEYIANDILNKKIELNKVYIYGINKDNELTINRIFNNYNIKINMPPKISLLEILAVKNYLKDFNLENIKEPSIKNEIIKVLNKYAWCDDKSSIKDMLLYEFQNTYLGPIIYDNAINLTNLFNEHFNEDEYIYIINFNNEYIPKIYKDTDFISDSEKFSFLESTNEKNKNEKNNWNFIIHSLKNLTITSSKNNLNGPLTESSLVNDFNYEIINKEYETSNYSNTSNLFNMGILLDNFQKDNILNQSLITLLNTYSKKIYKSYNNAYSKINYSSDFTLSYSKMNTYYECPFKYFCDNILKLNEFENNFDTFVGSLFHDILSKIYNKDFNYEKAKEEYFLNHPFNLTKENSLFLNRLLNDFKYVIDNLKLFYNNTKYQNIETEKNIEIDIDGIKFKGIIDKVMSYNDNYVLIDYKTGTPNIDLRLIKYGLNLQLPIYIYLTRQIYPDAKITGLYLQHLLKPQQNKEEGVSSKEVYDKSLKLKGYSIGNEDILKDFDPTYQNSDFIYGLKLTNNGFSSTSKVLTEKDFLKLEEITKEQIQKCISNIKEAKFDIKPKIVGRENISCPFCPYASVCFKKEKDEEYLSLDDNLFGGDNNEMDH